MNPIKNILDKCKNDSISEKDFKEFMLTAGNKPENALAKGSNIHIFHHYDADGFAAAAVIIKFVLSRVVSRENILCYVCEHSTKMDLSNIKENEFVFIVDYSFPDCDKDDLKKLYNNVTKNIIWIDHHSTSDLIINSDLVFKEIANNGLIETSNKYAGCMLSYFWSLFHYAKYDDKFEINNVVNNESTSDLFSHVNFEKLFNEAPLWVKLVSDHDTFRHEFDTSIDFNKGLTYEGLFNVFINPEAEWSFTNMLDSDKIDILIEKITNEGNIITNSEDKKNKKLVKNNGFETTFVYHDHNHPANTKEYHVICFNGYGNSLVFGDLYDRYDAVCIFNYTGINYRYSMFAKSDSEMDCSCTALYFNERYKMNGGGHKHACGWSTPVNIFERHEVIDIYKTF